MTTAPPEFEAHGLRVELPVGPMRGPLVSGRPPQRGITLVACLPAVLLLTLLLVPAAGTVVLAVRTRLWPVVGCVVAAVAFVAALEVARRGAHRSLWAVPAAVGTVALAALYWSDESYARSLYWMAFAAALLVAAMLLAWWTRYSRGLWLPLIVPFGISAIVSGVAFRLIFQYSGARLGFDGFPGYRAWFVVMLGSAFLWTWLGFLIGVFRAGIRALERDPVRWTLLREKPGITLVWRLFTLQRPIVLVAGLVVGVAAARVFDVVLIGVPGSVQYQVDSATVSWWRLATDPATAGDAAAYALPLAALLGVVAWALQTDIQDRRTGFPPAEHPGPGAGAPAGGSIAGWARGVVIGAVSVAAVIPLVVLAVVALRGPDGWSAAAFTDVWRDRWLLHSVEATFWVAVLATIIVVATAAPLAYRLAVAPAGWVTRTIVTALVVLAVLPVQAYLGPLDIFIDDHGLSGTRVPLVLVHAAAGLPIAVLILRGAVAAPPGSPAADALRGLAAPGTISRRLLGSAGPALVAVAVLEFVQVWNDFIVGLLISGAGASPWSLLLWGEARQFGENAAQLAAGALIAALLPVALVLATWRRWIVPGLTGGVLR
ncbi:carbohydrate ABC transporter permease [Nocardia jinanensis]|uniref:ABC transmembrane type-1 domain-containing protein n=1 Tax=Nocardia jinanensis TaxID=382504 RepID=A0A917RCV4_9NOCA|nr:carbohydrate ABC transporter permease [Nocardia jinanensis]GGL00188.1 hypothetical protein GCM10011588_13610 [Nocardia jinanensis]